MKHLLHKKATYLWGVALSLIGFFASAAPAYAGLISGFVSGSVNNLLGGTVNFFAAAIELTLLPLSSFLVDTAFRLQAAQGFIDQSIVQTGWKLTIDLANMAFILVLIVIGLATILRMESYGIKRLLPKLVLVALLINFSLVIGGVFIDMGNDITSFFIYGDTKGAAVDASVGQSIAAAFNLSQTLKPNKNFGKEMENENIDAGLLPTVHALARLVIASIASFTLLAIAIMLVFRMVYLWILLALAPIAWISLVIPKAGGYWSKWWNDFLKWSFVPAVMAFFLFFGLTASKAVALTGLNEAALPGAVPFNTIGQVLQFIVVVIIMLFGVTVAPRWTGQGGDTAMKWAGGVKNWTLGKVKGYTGKKLVAGAGRASEKALYDKEGKARGLVKKLSRVPGARQALRAPVAAIEKRRKDIQSEAKRYGSMTNKNQKLLYGTADANGKMAILQNIAKDRSLPLDDDGNFDESKSGAIKEGNFESMLKLGKRFGVDKEILEAAPQFAEIVGKEIEDIIKKMSPGKAKNIQRQSFSHPEVYQQIKIQLEPGGEWDKGHISSLGKEDARSFFKLMKNMNLMDNNGNIIDSEVDQLKEPVREFLYSYVGRKLNQAGGSPTP